MSITEKPGILELAEAAVQPLIADGEFAISRITFKNYQGELLINLISPDLDITFQSVMRGHSGVDCYLRANSQKKVFLSKYLFPLMSVAVPIRKSETIKHYTNRVTENPPGTYQEETENMVEKSGCIDEIHRQSISMKNEIWKIREILAEKNIGETIRRYIVEIKKNNRADSFLEPVVFLDIMPAHEDNTSGRSE